jgi:Rrf2 family protein
MKYSTRLSDAVHLLLFVHLNSGQSLSSAAIAKSICTNPSYVRQMMAKLKAAGLLNSNRGQAKPSLSRAAEDISLLDVYRAVEGEKRLLHLDTHTNPDCGVGVHIQYALQDYFDRVQQETERAMQQITLQNVLDTYHQEISYGGHTEN